MAQGDLNRAVLRFTEALVRSPGDQEAWTLKAEAERLLALQMPPPGPEPSPDDPSHPKPEPDLNLPLPRRAGETLDAWRARYQRVQGRFEQAEALLKAGNVGRAVTALAAIVEEEPNYEAATTLLARARQAAFEQARRDLGAGRDLEKSGDTAGALQKYESARLMDPSFAEAGEAVKTLRAAMTAEGEELYSRARQLDAVGLKTTAIDLYERAIKLLPADSEKSRLAAERLRILKGGSGLDRSRPRRDERSGPRGER
jgi:tetratricopeptide (TPR) repeat protein